MKTTVQILKDAKQLLIDKGWTQGEAARNKEGRYADVLTGDAVCFCGLGAVWHTIGNHWRMTISDAEVALRKVVSGHSFADFNDAPGRTLEEVLAKFDEAIAAEEAKVAA